MRFFQIFSRRSGRSAGDLESWQIGDWAECLKTGTWYLQPENRPSPGPRHGQIMKVTGVKVCRAPRLRGGKVLTLSFAGWPDEFFEAARFRKCNPRADEATPAEAAFTDLVRRAPHPAAPAQPKIEEFQ